MGLRTFALFALASLATVCALTVRAETKSVVAILGSEVRTPMSAMVDRGFRQVLGTISSAHEVQIYAEHLDNARFPGPEHEQRFAEYMRDRYAGKPIDLMVTVDPNALRFLNKYRDLIRPGVPVVFAGVPGRTLERLELPRDFIGVAMEPEAGPTIRMALQLRPSARELVVVSGVGALEQMWDSAIRATPLPPHVKMRVLQGLSMEAVERELAALGPDSVVVTPGFLRDGAGRTYPGGVSVIERLSHGSGAPVFGVYDTGVGSGAVGSFSPPREAIVLQTAGIAKLLLEGTPIQDIKLPAPVAPVPIVDWRELRRWGIDESRLLPGTEVRFRVPTFWEHYRYHVVAVAALVLLETALVAGLLLQRRRRRGVEERLRQSERTMQLAANAAQLVMWNWDIEGDRIWLSDGHRAVTGAKPRGQRTLDDFLASIHPEDRDAVQRAIERALAGDGNYETEYRIVGADGITRWFVGRGRVEQRNNAPLRLHGVTLDVTRRKSAELEAQRQRNELAHLSRITLLGELSVSMAHELNQPLMAILSNAQAARMFIAHDPVDLVELGAILDDIVENDKRAGEIIWSMRKMLKKEEAARESLPVNDVVQDVLRLMRSDLMNRGVAVEAGLAEGAPAIRGDRMQLQQVLVNLILNACDAMAAVPKGERALAVRTESSGDGVRVSVVDHGAGIPPEALDGIFTPFFTTKKHGLGLGLSVCSSIIASHGGELRAVNNARRGATFSFVLKREEKTETQAEAIA
jgi:C4-dicarboxylate-specific signal transduction histidine kinase